MSNNRTKIDVIISPKLPPAVTQEASQTPSSRPQNNWLIFSRQQPRALWYWNDEMVLPNFNYSYGKLSQKKSYRHSQNRLFDISVFYLLQKSRRSKQRKSHIIFLSASQSMSVFKFCKLYFLPEFPNSSFEFLLLQFFILLV